MAWTLYYTRCSILAIVVCTPQAVHLRLLEVVGVDTSMVLVRHSDQATCYGEARAHLPLTWPLFLTHSTVTNLVQAAVLYRLKPGANLQPGASISNTENSASVDADVKQDAPFLVIMTPDGTCYHTYDALAQHRSPKANPSCCPLHPRTTPFSEEISILGVIQGVLLWAGMNAVTPSLPLALTVTPSLPLALPLIL